MVNEERTEREINIADYLLVLRERKWIVIFSMFAIMLVVFIFTPRSPITYVAQVEFQAEGVFVRPGAVAKWCDSLMASSSFSEMVQKEIEKEQIFISKVVGESKPEAAKVNSVLEQTKVQPVKGSTDRLTMVSIGEESELTLRVANASAMVLARASISEEADPREELINSKLESLKKKVAQAEEALSRYKMQEGYEAPQIIKTPKKRTPFDTVETQYLKTKLDRELAEARLKVLRERASIKNEDFIPSITQTQSPMIVKLREELVELELQRTLLLREYTPLHPQVLELQKKIDDTITVLKQSAGEAVTAGEIAVDPFSVYQNQLTQIADLEVEVAGYKAREDALRELLRQQTEKIQDVVDRDTVLIRLQREAQGAKSAYRVVLNAMQKMRMDQLLNRGRVNLRIVALAKRATMKVEKGNLFIRLLIGALLGLVAGVAVAIVQEHADTSIKKAEDVPRYLDLVPLGVIPYITKKERR